jgi:hypothetical protein
MSWFETILTRLEAQLRQMVEGDAIKDGFPRTLHYQLEHALVHTMKAGRRQNNIGGAARRDWVVPDQYTLVLPSVEAQVLLTHPAELDRLTRSLESAASLSNLAFSTPPVLRVVADPQAQKISIQTGFSQPGKDNSATYQLEDASGRAKQASAEKLPNAFLIVNGLSTFPISTPTINIGRDPSNDLMLEDPRISAQHAQLRYVQGHFVIFDLDSRMGTFVNGVPVSSHALKAGDVIQLCGVPLVYGLESAAAGGQTQELPVVPPHPEVL